MPAARMRTLAVGVALVASLALAVGYQTERTTGGLDPGFSADFPETYDWGVSGRLDVGRLGLERRFRQGFSVWLDPARVWADTQRR